MLNWLKNGIQYLMETPESNSRFVFLLQGVAGAVGLLTVAICFCHGQGDKSGYPEMIWALGMVTGVAAGGRGLTKWISWKDSKGEVPKNEQTG